jgi:hypothetical protein
MPDFSKLKKAVYEANPTGQGMSFAQAGRMRREQEQAKKDAKEQIVKQVKKAIRPDIPLAETPEPKMYK